LRLAHHLDVLIRGESDYLCEELEADVLLATGEIRCGSITSERSLEDMAPEQEVVDISAA